MHLSHDLYDVYGRKIVARGVEIDPKLVREIARMGAASRRKLVSVRKTSLLADFRRALKDRRYHGLFTSPAVAGGLVRTFSQVKLPAPLLLELRRMKAALPETHHHVLVMSALVIKMIRDTKRHAYDPIAAARLCLTHDIGKTRIPARILNKKTELTLEEYHTIKTHPLIGYLLLSSYCGHEGRRCSRTAFEHHEKLDGSGYPRGIKGVDRYARLIAPVDIYDALISKRPYRTISYNGRLAIDILLEDVALGRLDRRSVFLLINSLRHHKVHSVAAMQVSQRRRTNEPPRNFYGKIKRRKARKLLKKD